jgi:hypothetical protein
MGKSGVQDDKAQLLKLLIVQSRLTCEFQSCKTLRVAACILYYSQGRR